MASGAVVSGIFGMNLLSKIEEYEYGFMLVCLGILIMMISIFVGFYQKYYQLRADTSSAHSFNLLKNFFMVAQHIPVLYWVIFLNLLQKWVPKINEKLFDKVK